MAALIFNLYKLDRNKLKRFGRTAAKEICPMNKMGDFMHKKISVGAAITIAVFSVIAAVLITTAVTMNIYSDLVSDLPQREKMYGSLSEIDAIIRENYFGDIEGETAQDGITAGYIDSLAVGTNYAMSASEYTAYKNRQSGTAANGESVKTVSYQRFGSAGYIKISDFISTTPSEFKSAYTTLSENGVTSLIIDVRDTDSINITSAAAIIDIIVPLTADSSKAIATAIDKNGKSMEIFSADSDSISVPVSVLVNENTTGAGELLACDIRDFGKGTVVGKTTAGHGTYQKIFETTDGGAIVMTVAKLMPYISDCFDGTGVVPDYETELEEKTDDLNLDTQFLRAYASVSALQK